MLKNSLAIHAAALNVTPRQAPGDARRLGFDGLLLDALSPTFDVTTLSGTGRREFRHLLNTPNIALVGLRVDLGIKGFGPGADVDRMLSRLDAILEAAIGVGALMTCIDLGPLPTPAFTPAVKPKINLADVGLLILPSAIEEPAPDPATPPPDPKLVTQIDDALLALGSLAERYSAAIAFSSSLAGFAALDRALTAANCPWFGIDLDPVALLRDRWSADEVFSRQGQLIRHVRARDAVVGSEGRTKPTVLARGDVKWRELLEALDGVGYVGWVTIDPMELANPRAAAISGLKQLRAYGE